MVLKQYLEDTKQTHETFAEKIGVTREHVTYMANGMRRPSLDVALRIEEVTDGVVPVETWKGVL